MKRAYVLRCTALALLFVALIPLASAQFNAAIQGTVSDSSGAIIPGAKVSVTNLATNQNSTTVTSNDGFYRVAGLQPGNYSVEVDAPNFKKQTVKQVGVAAESLRGVNVTLTVGATEQSVEVTDTA